MVFLSIHAFIVPAATTLVVMSRLHLCYNIRNTVENV